MTLYTDTNSEYLSKLKDIFLQSSDSNSIPVYLKIISQKQWEALILTSQHVIPSQEMISEIENILGKGTAVLS